MVVGGEMWCDGEICILSLVAGGVKSGGFVRGRVEIGVGGLGVEGFGFGGFWVP